MSSYRDLEQVLTRLNQLEAKLDAPIVLDRADQDDVLRQEGFVAGIKYVLCAMGWVEEDPWIRVNEAIQVFHALESTSAGSMELTCAIDSLIKARNELQRRGLIATQALEKISQMGAVCGEFETCNHESCRDSLRARELAQTALTQLRVLRVQGRSEKG